MAVECGQGWDNQTGYLPKVPKVGCSDEVVMYAAVISCNQL